MPIGALPTEILSLVLAQLSLVGNIWGVKRTCRAFRNAAAEAEKAHRRVCFVGHTQEVWCMAAAPDGRIVTGSKDTTIKVWRDGACRRTIQAGPHANLGHANANRLAVLPRGW